MVDDESAHLPFSVCILLNLAHNVRRMIKSFDSKPVNLLLGLKNEGIEQAFIVP